MVFQNETSDFFNITAKESYKALKTARFEFEEEKT